MTRPAFIPNVCVYVYVYFYVCLQTVYKMLRTLLSRDWVKYLLPAKYYHMPKLLNSNNFKRRKQTNNLENIKAHLNWLLMEVTG